MRSDALAPTETIVGSTSTINFRLAVWPWALEAIRAFAFSGTGLGAFRAVGPRLFPINVPPETDFAHAHNQLLQTALDVGLPGLVAYVALLLVAATVGWRVAVTHRTLRPFALGLLAGLAGLHVYGLTDALALGAKPGVLLWGALGLLAAVAGDALNDHGR
jgi:putative inorganic carbon (HCO3(-)) transporter